MKYYLPGHLLLLWSDKDNIKMIQNILFLILLLVLHVNTEPAERFNESVIDIESRRRSYERKIDK